MGIIYTPGPDIRFKTGVIGKVTDETEKTVSGAVVSFADGADNKKLHALSISIEPVQDLHGYDASWPAGGGKNLYNKNEDLTEKGHYLNNTDGAMENSSNWYISYIPVAAGTVYSISGVKSSSTFIGFWWLDSNKSPLSIIGNRTTTPYQGITAPTGASYMGLSLIWNTSSDSYDGNTLQVEVGSTATQYAPYENICPISGWTSAVVTRTGINIWDEEWELGSISSSTGKNTSSTTGIRGTNYIPVKPGATYYLKCPVNINPYLYKNDQSFIGRYGIYVCNSEITIPDNCYYMRIALPAAYGTTYNNDISINYPASVTNYIPHTGNFSLTINLAGTIYGGTLDVLTGMLTVDRAIFNISDFAWTLQTSADRTIFRLNKSDIKTGTPNVLTSMLPFVGGIVISAMPDKSLALLGQQFRIYDSAATTLESFNSTYGNCQICYELDEPVIYQLTGEQMITILGQNNVWADCGDVFVTYPVSVKIPVIIPGINDQDPEEPEEEIPEEEAAEEMEEEIPEEAAEEPEEEPEEE